MRKSLSILLAFLFVTACTWADDTKTGPPKFTFSPPGVEGLTDYFTNYAQRARNELMKDYQDTLAEPGVTIMNPWSLDMNAHKTYAGKFITVEVDGYDFRGGAHGIPYLDVLYFDADSKKELAQKDILVDGSYEALSRLTRAGLVKQGFDAQDEWMLQGTEPKAENFKMVVPHDDGVEVIFSSYQVAPYAAGVPSVKIPWNTARELFSESYRP